MSTAIDFTGGLVRGAQMAATMSIFGLMLFRLWIAGPSHPHLANESRDIVDQRFRRLILGSLVTSLVAALAWLLSQSSAMTDAESFTEILAQVPVVLWHSHFGELLIARIVLLLAGSFLFLRQAYRAGCVAGLIAVTVAVLLQTGLGHGLAMGGTDGALLLVMEAGHLLAAGAWLGSLLPLLLYVQSAPYEVAVNAVRRFSRMATACVGVLVLTIIVQSWVLIGSLAGLIGTDYGRLCLIKAALLLLLLTFAALNKWRLTPALSQQDDRLGRRWLGRSIAAELLIGLLAILAAGTLLTLAPAIHEQPLWPFSQQLSLVATEDPDLRNEMLLGAGQLIIGLGCFGIALWWRRLRYVRWLAAVAAITLGWWSTSHLDLLLVPAYPTSFYTSPTGFTAASIASGAQLFAANCTSCHGVAGRGDGPQAAGMAVKPADLTAGHLFAHSDGELFWWLTSGIQGPTNALVMPGFADQLEDDDRWSLIDYIRAHNAGLAQHDSGTWSQPMQAPDITVPVDGKEVALSSLKGRILRLVARTPDEGAPPALPADLASTAITVEIEPELDAWTAYAIMAGVSSDHLAGTAFLVDRDGWLRTVLHPGSQPGWTDPEAFIAAMRQAEAAPITTMSMGHHHHM